MINQLDRLAMIVGVFVAAATWALRRAAISPIDASQYVTIVFTMAEPVERRESRVMITVDLLHRIRISRSRQGLSRTRKGESNAILRSYACPNRYLLVLGLLVSLSAQGCKSKLTMGDFVKAYCMVYSPDHKQVALGVLESERRNRSSEDTQSDDPDRLSPRGDYDRLFPPPVYIQHFPIYL